MTGATEGSRNPRPSSSLKTGDRDVCLATPLRLKDGVASWPRQVFRIVRRVFFTQAGNFARTAEPAGGPMWTGSGTARRLLAGRIIEGREAASTAIQRKRP
jgi:hypothetical protein